MVSKVRLMLYVRCLLINLHSKQALKLQHCAYYVMQMLPWSILGMHK
jgi:hypothetical protein